MDTNVSSTSVEQDSSTTELSKAVAAARQASMETLPSALSDVSLVLRALSLTLSSPLVNVGRATFQATTLSLAPLLHDG